MDIKLELEKLVNNESFAEVVRTTTPFILHLKTHSIQITEAVLKHYMNHVQAGNVDPEKKELFEFILRDTFARTCEILSDDFTAESEVKREDKKKEEKLTAEEDNGYLLTPEEIAESQKDLPPYVDPGPSDFFLELQELLGDKEESDG